MKALIEIDGRTLLLRTIEALRLTGMVRRIAVVGPESVLKEARAAGADLLVPELASGPENVLAGLEAVTQPSGEGEALVVTTDLPMLTPQVIEQFLCAIPESSDIAAPVVSAADFQARFPGCPSTYLPLKGGAITLGCAFLVRPAAIRRNSAYLRNAFQSRKSNWAMARLAGGRVAARYATGRLTVADIERRASQVLACSCAALEGAPPELAFDIDEIEEYQYAVKWLAQPARIGCEPG